MAIVVQKYGGTSVADVERIRRVAERVVRTAELGHEMVVVVSAMGKTTDGLIELARQVADPPPRRELDMLLSTGERISMSLLAMAIGKLGREAISFTGSQSGIITDDRHVGARILEVRPVRIREELAKGRIVIVAGFQGVSRGKEVTTLGRGGSDTTAVALAAALRAAWCEICSDVDGVWTSDPRVVPEARKLEDIGYEQMQELAIHGAKVLCAQAVEWAKRAGIEIAAIATTAPGGGTRVGSERANSGDPVTPATAVTAVTGCRDLTRLVFAREARTRALGALGAHGIAPRTLQDGADAFAVTFGRADLPDWHAVRAVLLDDFGGALRVEDDLGSVTLVGHGVGSDPALVARILELAAPEGRPPRGLDATPLRVTVLVAPADVDTVVRGLHAAFVAPQSSSSGASLPVPT